MLWHKLSDGSIIDIHKVSRIGGLRGASGSRVAEITLDGYLFDLKEEDHEDVVNQILLDTHNSKHTKSFFRAPKDGR